MNNILIVGAGGHAQVIADAIMCLAKSGSKVSIAGFLDDDNSLWDTCNSFGRIHGPINKINDVPHDSVIVGIGINEIRHAIYLRLKNQSERFISIVHPMSCIASDVKIGEGTIVCAGTIINTGAYVGDNVIINTGSTIDHHNMIGSHAHIGPGSHIGGNVSIGEGAFLGVGSIAIPGRTIGEWSIIGAGGVVIKDIPARVTAIGVPAQIKSSRSKSQLMQRIYLSPPNLDGRERELLMEAYDSNWITTLGPQVDTFETELAHMVKIPYATALASGTSAIHLALINLGVGPGDEVLCSSFTFSASANPIVYCGATPVFIDSNKDTWNMDPLLLEEELRFCAKKGRLPKAIVVVDLYGQCADYDPILRIAAEYDVPVIEDAAEALGATYKGMAAGSFGEMGILSFNGNKIITTSGGGMLVSNNKTYIEKAKYLSTQARDPAPHYQHTQIGFNYRMSNLLAAIGRGQLENLDRKVAKKREINAFYRDILKGVPGIEFMPESAYGKSNCWLTCITIDPEKFGATNEDVRLALEVQNIESRPTWKPMHLQPVFSNCRVRGGAVSDEIFVKGLCLPSGSAMTDADLRRVVEVIFMTGDLQSEWLKINTQMKNEIASE